MRVGVIVTVFVCVIGLLAFAGGALLPAEWTIQRSTIVEATPAQIYPLIANFKSGWSQWNPWLEANMTLSYSGPEEGPGATQSWEGGDTNGGRIQIISADPLRGVEFALTFGPFPINGTIAMTATGGRTTVTWTNTGRIAGLPVYRYMRFVLERFVGKPMDRGLADLKRRAEARS